MTSKQKLSKTSPILVIGYGSIGQRHYRNLLILGFTNVAVYDVNLRQVPVDVQHVRALTPSLLKEYAVVLVCNPTHLHVSTARDAIRSGAHVFIEKPLSHSSRGIKKLIAEHKEINMKLHQEVMVGCNFRFHPGYQLLTAIIQKKSLGKLLTLNIHIGHDLSQSRKGVDYRKTYAVDPEKGGGVIIDSGSHAVDYLLALLGPVTSIQASYGNISELKMKAEDYANVILSFSGVIVTLILDYFSKPKQHRVEAGFEKGTLVWDFPNDTFEWFNAKTGKHERQVFYKGMTKDEARNDMYLRELKYFIALINGKSASVSSLSNAAEVTNILLAIKKAGKYGKRIDCI